ncbi:MAG: hypothetical protein SH850_06010 [Planctomycetaceae bacterium]|nr:hypothetical protein [Planctomycetaceae bacterium]
MSTTWPTSSVSPRWSVMQPEVAVLREPLLALWRRNLPTAAEHRFEWLYASGRARAWTLGENGAALTGAAGLMLRRLSVHGTLVDSGGAIDLNVDQAQRSVGPALTLVRAITDAADADQCPVLFGMPNRAATMVMKRAGYRELGEFSSWTKLLRSERKVRQVLGSLWAAKLAAPVTDLALKFQSREWTSPLPRSVITESPTGFDQRFNRLWEQAAGSFDVIGERTADYLHWRFASCPDLDYRIFTLAERSSGDLLGYVVWWDDGEQVGHADLAAVDEPTTLLLLAEFSRHARRLRATAISFGCFAPPWFYQLLRASGFHHRANRHPVLCRWLDASTPAGRDSSAWYLTKADCDTDV